VRILEVRLAVKRTPDLDQIAGADPLRTPRENRHAAGPVGDDERRGGASALGRVRARILHAPDQDDVSAVEVRGRLDDVVRRHHTRARVHPSGSNSATTSSTSRTVRRNIGATMSALTAGRNGADGSAPALAHHSER
jgi:hypothetical protein